MSPSRKLEKDFSEASYERFRASTAALEEEQLVRAYKSTWEWGLELIEALSERHGFTLPTALLEKLERHVSDHRS